MFKNIIFDWSGVIKDALDAHLWVVNKIIVELGGQAISIEEFKKNWEEPYMNFWKNYYPELTYEEEHEMYSRFILSKECPESASYLGIVDLIKKLKQNGAYMIVLSSDFPETVLPEMKRFGLENIFSEVVTLVYDKKEKIGELMRAHSLKPEDTIFVGDSANEVKAGKSVGIKTLSVTWGLYSEEKLKLSEPNYLVNNIKDLEKVLLA
jgi:HAD superfamily hydrolase (TIGR01509 family)